MDSTSNAASPLSPRLPSAHIVPDPPPALAQGVADAIRAIGPGHSVSAGTPETFLAAAECLFDRVLSAGCTARTSALDLLVVDALVTYAFERASDEPASIEAKADRAMLSLACLPGPAGQRGEGRKGKGDDASPTS